MNNDDLSLHSMTKLSGWLCYYLYTTFLIETDINILFLTALGGGGAWCKLIVKAFYTQA